MRLLTKQGKLWGGEYILYAVIVFRPHSGGTAVCRSLTTTSSVAENDSAVQRIARYSSEKEGKRARP